VKHVKSREGYAVGRFAASAMRLAYEQYGAGKNGRLHRAAQLGAHLVDNRAPFLIRGHVYLAGGFAVNHGKEGAENHRHDKPHQRHREHQLDQRETRARRHDDPSQAHPFGDSGNGLCKSSTSVKERLKPGP
jgi:hypothetical protein